MFRCVLVLIVVLSVSLETAAEQEAVNAARLGAPLKRSDVASWHLKKRSDDDVEVSLVSKRDASTTLNQTQIDEILEAHNIYRRSENASNIHRLVSY